MPDRFAMVKLPREQFDPVKTEQKILDWLLDGDLIDVNTSLRKQVLVSKGTFLVLSYYFSDDMKQCYDSMSKVILYADEYFFGQWRDKVASGNNQDELPSREFQDVHSLWSSEFLSCILCCSCLGKWQKAKEFASFLRTDVCLDPNQKVENRAWILYLAGVISGRNASDMDELKLQISNGSSKREHVLFDFLQAILESGDAELEQAANKYFKFYKSYESKRPAITQKVAIDCTVLVHFAKHQGREISVPSNMEVHIIPQQES